MNGKRIIISGGGTGGHIFPAVSIANALKRIAPDTEVLFVGALGRMEMERVPAAGYRIVGLDIQGFNRSSLWMNIKLPFKLIKSLSKARKILEEFKPHVAVGVGGYASGPLLHVAGNASVPYIIQEQNSYAGMTNKRLANKASKICVAFEHMDRFFPKDKIMLTGNPIRQESVAIEGKRQAALNHFNLSAERKTILVIGGSLGSSTLNKSVIAAIDLLIEQDLQVIWQCGKYYFESYRDRISERQGEYVKIYAFMDQMDYAYAAADVIVSRAGAGTISELCVIGKPVVLVPSPNVAEDHQTINARSLVDRSAALMVSDVDAEEKLMAKVMALLADDGECDRLSTEIKKMAITDADVVIAEEVLKLADRNEYR